MDELIYTQEKDWYLLNKRVIISLSRSLFSCSFGGRADRDSLGHDSKEMIKAFPEPSIWHICKTPYYAEYNVSPIHFQNLSPVGADVSKLDGETIFVCQGCGRLAPEKLVTTYNLLK